MDKRKQRLWSGRALTALTLLLAAGLILSAVLILFSGGFTREKAAQALWYMLPAACLWAAAAVWGNLVRPAPSRRGLRVLPAEGKHPTALRLALYALAVLLVILGVMNGGIRDVLFKAIRICTECIGLG